MNFRSFFIENDLPGGLGDNLSSQDVDQAELQKGIAHEMEHTQDEALAKEIALDHLAENPHYYSDLDSYMPHDDAPKIDMPVGGQGQVPVGGIVTPQAFAISVKTGGTGTSFSNGGGAEGVSQPGDKSKITAAGKTDTSFAEKTVGGPVTKGEGQEQGGPNTQGTIANTPENNDIEGSNAPGSTPKNDTIMSGEAKGSTPKNTTIGEDGEDEKEDDGEKTEVPWAKDKEEEDDEVGELKEIIKKEIKDILQEMWMGWQDHEQESVGKMTNETAPPDFPQDLEDKLKKRYGKDSEKAYATMWKIHNKGWVDEIVTRVAESKKK